MELILRVLVSFFILASVKANTFQIKTEELGTPFYRSQTNLFYHTSRAESGSFSFLFKDKLNQAIDAKTMVKVSKTDFTDCTQDLCILKILSLPIALERYTCHVEIKFTSKAGVEIKNESLSWGNCEKTPSVPEAKYLPDFHFTEDAHLDDAATIEIMNTGFKSSSYRLNAWGFIKDRAGRIIWKSNAINDAIFNADNVFRFDFEEPLAEWQKRLACTSFVILDPEFEFSERVKHNNAVSTEFGDCEETPSEERGDKIDFVPNTVYANDLVSIEIKNDGRLPFLNETQGLETQLNFYDDQKNLILRKALFMKSPLHGFGDSKKFPQEVLPASTCHIQVLINPNITIKESNYLNNKFEIDICHN